jgi:hypothetical protein
MLLAELEIWHSRPIAPTRRVAVGRQLLPLDPAPGFGGLLLGAIVAEHIAELDEDLFEELHRLLADLEAGRRIPQPRLRHRFQLDRHGLARSRHQLHGEGDRVRMTFASEGSPASQVLGAAYAAGTLDPLDRRVVMDVLRRAMRWHGGTQAEMIRHLSGGWASSNPSAWALRVLGFDTGAAPDRREVQRRFRVLLRAAHPDHGGEEVGAADRIADLSEARRILFVRA